MAENKTAKTSADGPEYERGFVDGMQRQMQLHVNRIIREEPTAWQCQCGRAYTVACASSKPSKQWVGLTDEELEEMHNEIKVRLMGTYRTKDIYRSIEAKLKEKNI